VSSHIKTDCLFRMEANQPTPQTYPLLCVFKPFGETPHGPSRETLENKVRAGPKDEEEISALSCAGSQDLLEYLQCRLSFRISLSTCSVVFPSGGFSMNLPTSSKSVVKKTKTGILLVPEVVYSSMRSEFSSLLKIFISQCALSETYAMKGTSRLQSLHHSSEMHRTFRLKEEKNSWSSLESDTW
jgi:hypothetical protein